MRRSYAWMFGLGLVAWAGVLLGLIEMGKAITLW